MADNPKAQPTEPRPTPAPADTEPKAVSSEHRTTERAAGGLDRIREILFGEILAEIEKRLARIDHGITSRSSELAQDARRRTDVLEAHVRKELEAQSSRASHDVSEVSTAIRGARQEHRDALLQIDQRLQRVEDRIDSAVARVEREVRQQLLDQAKEFQDELARLRNELRWELARELGLLNEDREQGAERAAGPWASHH